jgi:DNA-binding MarR family transcriptional regulator
MVTKSALKPTEEDLSVEDLSGDVTDSSAKVAMTRYAGFLLAQLGRAVTRRYRTAMSPIGLNPRETYVLIQLRETGQVSQQTLGCTLEIDASNLVVLLNDLEVEGLISRRRDPEDRRRHVVEISAAGAKLVDEVMRTATRVEDHFFGALDADERVVLRDLLARVAESADLPWPPRDTTGEVEC